MLLSLALLSAAPAAVYAELLDLDDLSAAADQVVLGEVSAVDSRRVPGGIITEVTVDVSETLLGDPAADLTLTLPGGRVGGETMTVSGVPRLLVGHDLLLFLDDGQPVGFTQGILFTEGDQARLSHHAPPIPLEEVRRTVQ